MLNKIISFLLKKKLGRAVLVPVGRALRAVKGKKTEILLGVLVVLYALEASGVLPEGAATAIKEALGKADPETLALGSAAAVTLAEKIKDNPILESLLDEAEDATKD